MQDDAIVDVIVRFHDTARLSALDRCIFSLIAQEYRPLHIHLATQRFTPKALAETRARLEPLLRLDPGVGLTMVNWDCPEPADARSILANLGLAGATGRYTGFLDFDDTLYPEAYRLLVDRLRESGAAIAFGGVCYKIIDDCHGVPYTRAKEFPFKGTNLYDLFTANFCPIHSFLFDRHQLPAQFVYFDPLVTRSEDYDFLIRVCSQYQSDFGLLEKIIADYYIRTDGTNTVNTVWGESPQRQDSWLEAEAFLEQRRRMTPISAAVQRSLGLRPRPKLTIREFLGKPMGTAPVASTAPQRLSDGAR